MKYLLPLIGLSLLLAGCSRPIAKFSAPTTGAISAGDVVQFDNYSTNAETYLWDFGDETTSTEATPKHQYWSSGVYHVTLTATKAGKSRKFTEKIKIHEPEKCLVLIATDFGNMVVELNDATPQHRDNFLSLTEQEFYDGLLFHRVIGGFMIQGGDPNSKNAEPGVGLGSGGPGYTIPAEIVDTLFHFKGALAAARTSDAANPDRRSSGSQFYIVQGRPTDDKTLDLMEARNGFRYSSAQRERYKKVGGTPHLDGQYTVFGRVVSGLDVIDKISEQPTDQNNRPKKDIPMNVSLIK